MLHPTPNSSEKGKGEQDYLQVVYAVLILYLSKYLSINHISFIILP